MVFLTMVAAALLSGDNSATDATIKKEIDSLQGTWLVVMDVKGDRLNVGWFSHFTFTGEKIRFRSKRDGKEGPKEGIKFRVDPSKDPKELDIVYADDFTEFYRCIYELDGDKLKLCMARLDQRCATGVLCRREELATSHLRVEAGETGFRWV